MAGMKRLRWYLVVWIWGCCNVFAQTPSAPYAATFDAAPINATAATLRGMATPNGLDSSAWFEWGSTTNYGNLTPAANVGSGFNVVFATNRITELPVGSSYFYRLVVSNAVGIARGRVQRFITGGKVVAWSPRTLDRAVPLVLRDAVAVAAGTDNYALRADGTVVAWGRTPATTAADRVGLTNIIGVVATAGATNGLALRQDGTVAAWQAAGYSGSLLSTTNVPGGLSNVVSLSLGRNNAYALRSDGTVVSWRAPSSVASFSNIVQIAARDGFCLALKNDGSLMASSTNEFIPANATNLIALAASSTSYLALRADGVVLSWGYANGKPVADVRAGFSNVATIVQGPNYSAVLMVDGRIVAGSPVPGGTSNVVSFAVGNNQVVGVRPLVNEDFKPFAFTQPAWPGRSGTFTLNGTVFPAGLPTVAWFEWGPSIQYGNVTPLLDAGDGASVVRLSAPVQLPADQKDFHFRIVASNSFGVATAFDGQFTTGRKVAAWSLDQNVAANLPAGLQSVVKISAGEKHSVALLSDRTVVAWGDNSTGATNVPPGLSNVVEVSAGPGHTLALLENGTVTAWGSNSYGRLRMGVPAGLSNVIALASGHYFSFALQSDGTWTAWSVGALTNQYFARATDLVAIGTDLDYPLAIRCDGTAVSWAYDLDSIIRVTNVVGMLAGVYKYGFLKADGKLIDFEGTEQFNRSNLVGGAFNLINMFGLTAEGEVMSSHPIPGLTHAIVLSAGIYNGLALGPNVPPRVLPGRGVGLPGNAMVIPLGAIDLNSDPLTFEIVDLPVGGTLRQFSANGLGDPITAPGTRVTDALGRVVFQPADEATAAPYATIGFRVSDGEAVSAPGTFTIDLIPQPTIHSIRPTMVGTNWAVTLGFDGHSNASYHVYVSKDLINWLQWSIPTQTAPGAFEFNDSGAGYYSNRFYRIKSP